MGYRINILNIAPKKGGKWDEHVGTKPKWSRH